MTDHPLTHREIDDRPVWQIAASEGTETAAVRELVLEHWPNMAESEAKRAIRAWKRANK